MRRPRRRPGPPAAARSTPPPPGGARPTPRWPPRCSPRPTPSGCRASPWRPTRSGCRSRPPRPAVTAVRIARHRPAELAILDPHVPADDGGRGSPAGWSTSTSRRSSPPSGPTTRIGERLLWGNVAASIAAVFRAVESSGPAGDAERPGPRARRFFAAAAPGSTASGDYTCVEVPGALGWYWDRTSCCLWYQTTSGAYCDDCSLHDPPSCEARRRAELIGSDGAVIWFLTNVDTEVLALRTAVEALPAGFPRGARRAAVDASTSAATSTAPRCVLVRLLRRAAGLGGRLRRAARRAASQRGIPFLAFAGEAVPDAELTALSTVPSAIAHRGLRLPRQRRPARTSSTCCASWPTPCCSRASASTRRRQIPTHGVWRAPASDDAEPPAGRRRLLPGPPRGREHPVRRPTCATRIEAARRRRGRRVVLLAAGRRRRRRCSTCCASPALDVLITTVLAAGGVGRRRRHRRAAPAGSTATTWDASALAALDVPIIQAPSSGQSVADWVDDPARPRPLRRHRGRRHPRVRRPGHRPGLRLQRGGRRRRRARQRGAGLPHRARPGRRGSPASPSATPGCGARRPARAPGRDRAQRLPDQAQPARQRRRARHAGVGHARSSTRWRPTGYAHRPPPGRRRRAHGRAGRRPHLRGRAPDARRSSPPRSGALDGDRYAGWFATLPADARGRARAARGVRRRAASASTTASSCSAASTSATCSSPSSRPAATATTRSPSTTRPTCRPPTTTSPSTAGSTRSGAPTPSSTSASTARSSGCRARRWRCRPGAGPTPPSATCRSSTRSSSTTRARARRPSGGPTPWSSTTCCRR